MRLKIAVSSVQVRPLAPCRVPTLQAQEGPLRLMIESPSSMLVVGGADGMANWLVRKVFGKVDSIQRIALADIRPLDGIPHPRLSAEVEAIGKQICAVSLDYGSTDLLST